MHSLPVNYALISVFTKKLMKKVKFSTDSTPILDVLFYRLTSNSTQHTNAFVCSHRT